MSTDTTTGPSTTTGLPTDDRPSTDGGPSTPDLGPVSGSTATQPVVVEPTGPALGTLVWGCTALAVGTLLGLWEVADVRVDAGLVVPVGMVALGLLLVVGAVVTAFRQRR